MSRVLDEAITILGKVSYGILGKNDNYMYVYACTYISSMPWSHLVVNLLSCVYTVYTYHRLKGIAGSYVRRVAPARLRDTARVHVNLRIIALTAQLNT